MSTKNQFIFHGGIRLKLFALETHFLKDRTCFCRLIRFPKNLTKFQILHHYSMLLSIPPSWRKLLLSNKLPQSVFCDPITDKRNCKAVYKKLLFLETILPTTAE